MSGAEQQILVAVRNGVGHLTLNRPAGLNALTLVMVRQLQRQLDAWAQDAAIRAVVLRGVGDKAFCAGGDIRALYDSQRSGDDLHLRFLEEEYALDQCLHAYPKPVLALLDGYVLGGGMGLAQAASLRLVTERTRMAMPEVGIGFFPDVGGSYFLPRLPGELGLYLGVSGVQIGAGDALYSGLADHFLASERLGELDARLDRLSWSNSPEDDLRALLAELASGELPDAELKRLRPAIDRCFAAPDLPAILAALQAERQENAGAWAERTLQLLASRSPLAMAVTLELLRRGRQLDLSDCFALELHLDRQWFAKGDFMEGVRALIIDKDKTPRWNPPSLAELPPARVQAFFAGFQPGQAGVGCAARTSCH
ncbi:enoyl-CoA hydratase/isomerase family protein [Pseudomonas sp. SP16.1]|uniref:enoyl-CoA hydratase/isomerase family protein n=1 Tax=Pseudomonas sp. SP16.1 TaxID=3458854 RepID=UPI0040460A75